MAQATRANIKQSARAEAGQTLILLTFALAALLGLSAMVIDVGLAYEEKRQEQNAVDAASLAGALELSASGSTIAARAAAMNYLARNGYTSADATLAVNIPPLKGPHVGDASFVEVTAARDKDPVFRAPLTSILWHVSARAVAGAVGDQPLALTFGALRKDCQSHTLLINAGGTLTVDGALYVNSCNVSKPVPPGYGDAFDIFGVGGHIQAAAVYVVGGWETHDGTTVSPNPLIHQPPIADPAAGLAAPDIATLTVRHGTAASPSKLVIQAAAATTLQPGVYYGGISVEKVSHVTLADGIYYIAGGGFDVKDSATLTAPHVLIYNSNTAKSGFNVFSLKGTGAITMGPIASGPYRGMTLFQDRLNDKDVTIDPANGLSGLSGTFYAPNDNATVIVQASGTTSMNILSGMINIAGASAHFTYDEAGVFGSRTLLAE